MGSRRRQTGFLPLTGYIALGAAAIILALGLALKLQSARLDAAQQKAKSLEQQVAQWQASAKDCSDSVANAQKMAEEANRKAKAALAAAGNGQVAYRQERARLEAEKAKMPVTACPSGEAVSTIRKGLKP